MKVRVLFLVAVAALLSSCATTSPLKKGEQYAKFYDEKPITLLVMPPINNSTNVEAKELLYTSISRPLIEAGYYVVSPHLAMDIFKAESAYDSELFVDQSVGMFGKVFGADAVVFTTIDSWEKVGYGIRTKISYMIKSTRTNEVIFDKSCDLYLSLRVESGNNSLIGILATEIASAINTALTDHIIAARKCNYYILSDIPCGKYSPMYMQDMEMLAEPKNISKTIK